MDINLRVQKKNKSKEFTQSSRPVTLKIDKSQASDRPLSSLLFSKIPRYLPRETLQKLLYLDLALACNQKRKGTILTILNKAANKNSVFLHENSSGQIAKLLQILWNQSEKNSLVNSPQAINNTFFTTGQEISRYIASEQRVSIHFKKLANRFAYEALLFAYAAERPLLRDIGDLDHSI